MRLKQAPGAEPAPELAVLAKLRGSAAISLRAEATHSLHTDASSQPLAANARPLCTNAGGALQAEDRGVAPAAASGTLRCEAKVSLRVEANGALPGGAKSCCAASRGGAAGTAPPRAALGGGAAAGAGHGACQGSPGAGGCGASGPACAGAAGSPTLPYPVNPRRQGCAARAGSGGLAPSAGPASPQAGGAEDAAAAGRVLRKRKHRRVAAACPFVLQLLACNYTKLELCSCRAPGLKHVALELSACCSGKEVARRLSAWAWVASPQA